MNQQKMDRWVGKIAVVTGSSSGIGLAITKYLVKAGMTVVGLARRKELMQKEMLNFEGKGKFFPLECDVSKEDNVILAFKWVKDNLGGVHVLVNNAAVLYTNKILDTNKDVWSQIVNVNILGLLCCTQQAVKLMKESGEEGHLININSITGQRIVKNIAFPLNIYPATKYAVTALTATLEMELLGTKIRTTSISPGVVDTEIFQVNSDKSVLENVAKVPALKPEDVAESIIYVLSADPHVQITELTIQVLGEMF